MLPARAVAIADPATTPYSAAAAEVMKTLGVCNALTGKIVHGADIAQTFQFVTLATPNSVRGAVTGYRASERLAMDRAGKPKRLSVPAASSFAGG